VTIAQAAIILVVSAAAGAAYNYARLGPMVARHGPAPASRHDYLSLEDVAAALARGDAIFIDCRTKAQFEASHIPGAINVPYDRIEEHWARVSDWIPTDAKVIVYGQARAITQQLMVEAALVRAGFSPSLLRGNFDMWQDGNLPVATGEDVVWGKE